MLDYPVALKFPDDLGPCSSRAVLPYEVTSQIVDGVLCSVKKQLDDERSIIVNQVKSLDSRFEELDKKFVGAINAVDSLVRVHDETKSCVAASESAKRTCLESRLDSLESKFDYVMHCVESLV
ncbi:uncharacterized protein LOC132638650 [Lycium barbarum]|uniref:uncharacterized protein LOC132638650 n=1 Tax=Lycium barbarum TaxID=112863 RepID=UPI00293E288D|nr:uncharacterized protein LOC132638650 [Lycium barbarum]